MTTSSATTSFQRRQGEQLQRLGILLFLFGLITGFLIPMMANPRMGLSSHLEGLMNGTFILLIGVIWTRLRLSKRALQVAFFLAVYGTFVNWAVTLVSGFWGAGGEMMPFAAEGFSGSALQEGVISFGLISLSLAMIGLSGLLLYGLRPKRAVEPAGDIATSEILAE